MRASELRGNVCVCVLSILCGNAAIMSGNIAHYSWLCFSFYVSFSILMEIYLFIGKLYIFVDAKFLALLLYLFSIYFPAVFYVILLTALLQFLCQNAPRGNISIFISLFPSI